MTAAPSSPPILRSALPLKEHFAPEYLTYHGVFPIAVANHRVQVAITNSPTLDVLDHIATTYCGDVTTEEVPRDILEQAVQEHYAADATLSEMQGTSSDELEITNTGAHQVTDARDLLDQPPVVRYVNLLLRDAAQMRASDVHLECGRAGMRVRVRIDGVLTTIPAPPRALELPVISRLKLLADLDIAQTRAPQDGRLRMRVAASEVDVRISAVPTQFGESLVLRLLVATAAPLSLDELGMSRRVRDAFEQLVSLPSGLVLATGPTGSGKTTTLHSALAHRASEREKLMSVENPIEYVVDGVAQVPVAPAGPVSFGTVLRSILRQDPDVIMVGEMRDEETAAIAVQAALTGHLVLSTLHTNDAPSAIARLLDLGIRPQLLADTLQGVLAQRLVRRCCPSCARGGSGRVASACDRTGNAGEGCARCRGTGYLGRVGIYELMLVTDAMRDAIVSGKSALQLADLARRAGMQTLHDACLDLAIRGATTSNEMHRVLGVGA